MYFFHQTLYESKDNNSKEHSYHKETNTSKIAQTRIESHHILFLRRVKEKKKDGRKCCLYILSILQTATPDEIHKYHCQESLMQRNQVSFALGKMIDTITFHMEVSF